MELYSSSRAQYLLKLFGILLHGSFLSFFSFSSLFSYLFMLWTFTLYFELQCNFVLKLCYSGCFGFGPSELFQWLPYSFDISPSLSVFCFRGVFNFFFILEHFIISVTIRSSRFILNISYPSPGINHFPGEPWFLLLNNGIRNQNQVAGELIASGVTYF